MVLAGGHNSNDLIRSFSDPTIRSRCVICRTRNRIQLSIEATSNAWLRHPAPQGACAPEAPTTEVSIPPALLSTPGTLHAHRGSSVCGTAGPYQTRRMLPSTAKCQVAIQGVRYKTPLYSKATVLKFCALHSPIDPVELWRVYHGVRRTQST